MVVYSKAGSAAEQIGVTVSALRLWADRGQLPKGSVMHTPGGHRLYRVDLIVAHLHRGRSRASRARRSA
jgi:DNA-binding transcriptional MerR regulator